VIRTRRLRLIACDEGMLRAIVAGPSVAAAHLGVAIPERWPEFPEAYAFSLGRFASGEDLRPWWTYVFIDDARRSLVGSGGYAGVPTAEGIVELGYETAPVFRGAGYASEATEGMLGFAFGHPGIAAVDAHTLAEPNASVRVLERNRFRCLGAATDPDVGPVWHWRITRAEWAVPRTA
jgi:RimJ/RimL family protein N-acetyltransferase